MPGVYSLPQNRRKRFGAVDSFDDIEEITRRRNKEVAKIGVAAGN